MAHTTKKMKLKRTMREVLDDEASAMSVEEELMNNVVKINGVWQFRSTQKNLEAPEGGPGGAHRGGESRGTKTARIVESGRK
jgi:hypothetical protein